MKKLLAIANGVALVSTILMNYLSNTGKLTGNTMSTISNRYANYFTPEGYAFSIWGLIYLGLLGLVFYTGRGLFKADVKEPILEKMGWWFVLSCIANSLWVVCWLNDMMTASIVLMLVLLLSLLKIVLATDMNIFPKSFKEQLFVYIPLGMYVGWISVATVANAAAWLTSLGWDGFGIAPQIWAIIMIVVAGFVNLLVINLRNIFVFGLVGIWALMAISVANGKNNDLNDIVYTCYAVSAILLVSIIARFLRVRKARV